MGKWYIINLKAQLSSQKKASRIAFFAEKYIVLTETYITIRTIKKILTH